MTAVAVRQVRTIARREIWAMFDQPTAYVLGVIFVAINAFLFFGEAYMIGAASLRPMLDLLPWLLLFIVPAVTMRSLAEDTRSGMLEVVLTQPVTEWEVVVGKYAGAVGFLWILLALTIPIPLGLALGASLPWGPVIAQYIGAALLTAALAGIGIWASSVTESQITAYILAVAVMFLAVLLGLEPVTSILPPPFSAVAARLGVLSHFEGIGRGVIDLRDAVYFVSVAGVFVVLAYGAMVRRRLAPTGATVRRLRLGIGVLTATLIVVNLLGGAIGGRLDLTPGRAYTLSNATKRIAGHLDDIVTIKVFASDELPASVAMVDRDLNDVLFDLRSAGRGRIRVVRLNPAKDDAAKRDAESLGIQPVQFNVVGQSELQVKQGYLGLAVQYGGQTETIPFVSATNDLEYRLVSDIRTLTRTKKPVVGLLVAGRGPVTSIANIRGELSKSYDVRPVTLADPTQPASDVSVLILVGAPDSLPSGTAERFSAFLGRGGSVLVLTGAVTVEPRLPLAASHPVAWNALLAPFGVSIDTNMVYDLSSNEVVPVHASRGGQMMQVLARYPLFLRVRSTDASPVVGGITDLFFPWASSIDTIGGRGYVITPLITTSKNAGVLFGETNIDPASAIFPQAALATRLLAAQVAPRENGGRGRAIVVGDGMFAADQFDEHVPDNIAFVLNAVDWLAQDESLISIRSKDRSPPPLAFPNAATREGVKYGNEIGVPLLLALWGFARLSRRRRRTREPYRPVAAGAAS